MSLCHFESITLQKSQFLVNKNIPLSQSFNTNKHIRDYLKILCCLVRGSYGCHVVWWCRLWAYKTICASFAFPFRQVLLVHPSRCIYLSCPNTWRRLLPCPWTPSQRNKLWCTLVPRACLNARTFTNAIVPHLSLQILRYLAWRGSFAMLRAASQRLRLTLKVREREMRQQNNVLLEGLWNQRDRGGSPGAPHWTSQWRLVNEVNHFVAAKALEIILITLDSWNLLEWMHVLGSLPFAVWVALLVVGSRAAPTSLVAWRAVLRDANDVLCGAPTMQVRRDLTGGPHVGFVVWVSSCRGHLE